MSLAIAVVTWLGLGSIHLSEDCPGHRAKKGMKRAVVRREDTWGARFCIHADEKVA